MVSSISYFFTAAVQPVSTIQNNLNNLPYNYIGLGVKKRICFFDIQYRIQ